MKKYMKIIIIVLCIFIVSGCNNKKDNDAIRFKNEYKDIDVDEYNNIKYSDIDSILDIIDNGSGVIYIGNSDNKLCNTMVPILLSASDSTNLDYIYYVNSKKISDEFSISDKDNNLIIDNNTLDIVPVVIFVYNGNIVSYHIGTIDNKDDLSEEEVMELYNNYLDGIHAVLNDLCSSDPNGEEHC